MSKSLLQFIGPAALALLIGMALISVREAGAQSPKPPSAKPCPTATVNARKGDTLLVAANIPEPCASGKEHRMSEFIISSPREVKVGEVIHVQARDRISALLALGITVYTKEEWDAIPAEIRNKFEPKAERGDSLLGGTK